MLAGHFGCGTIQIAPNRVKRRDNHEKHEIHEKLFIFVRFIDYPSKDVIP
jgi:hypothetical protein